MERVTSEFDARLEIKAFIARSRAPHSEWYAGLTADPQARIESHGLTESDWWIARRLATAEAARKIHEYLLSLGCEGPSGEEAAEDEEPTTVYAYWKRGHTTP